MTTQKEAREMAMALFLKHQVPKNWTFAFDHARARAGQTNYGLKRVTLSRHFVAANSPDRVRQTLLHEIAHVLAGPSHGHDAHWAAVCRAIGGDGKARYQAADTAMPEPPWRGTCGCTAVWKRHRLSVQARYAVCSACERHIRWEHTS